MRELLDQLGLERVVGFIGDTVREPQVNPTAALLVFGIGILLLVILGVAGYLLYSVLRSTATRSRSSARPSGGDTRVAELPVRRARPQLPAHLPTTIAGVVLIVFVGLIAFNVSTATRTVCESCHPGNPHAGSQDIDPHARVRCVSCHESGGAVLSSTIGGISRASHIIAGVSQSPKAKGYGRPISADACRRCHGRDISRVSVDERRGVRMSHSEPLAAGAQCVDCHKLQVGVVSNKTTGMAPCLRCHDQRTASVECSTCHTGDPAQAIRAKESTGTPYAQQQIKDVKCTGCHEMEQECDTCHGIRMPHTQAFKAGGHAREAAMDYWSDGSFSCKKCHYPGRRDCTKCHANSTFPAHGPNYRWDHQKAVPTACICHNRMASVPNRNFCAVCHPERPPLLDTMTGKPK